MRFHYRVRTVLLTHQATALTLSPGEWGHDSETETETVDGEEIPAWEPCDPETEGAEFMELGGKMTELRFDAQSDFQPGDLVSLTLVTHPAR